MSEQRSIFEAEAHAACLRSAGHATATDNALAEAEHAFATAGLGDLERHVQKTREFHRLCMARLAGVLRQLGEMGAE